RRAVRKLALQDQAVERRRPRKAARRRRLRQVDRRITLSIDEGGFQASRKPPLAGILMKLEHPDRLMNRTSLSLAALERHDAFADRHIGPDEADQRAMLDALGFASRAAFIDAVIPESIRRKETLPLGAFTQPKSEAEALASLRKLADENLVFRTYIGQ